MSKTLIDYAKEFEIDNNAYGKKEKLAYQTMTNIILEVSNHYHNDLGKDIRDEYLEMAAHLNKLSSMCNKKEVNEDEFDGHLNMVGVCASQIMYLLDEYKEEVSNDDVADHDWSQAVTIEHFYKH